MDPGHGSPRNDGGPGGASGRPLPHWHVRRARVAERSARLVLLIAGGGYGKTALATELAERDGATLVRIAPGLTEAANPVVVSRAISAVRDAGVPSASRLADADPSDPDLFARWTSALADAGIPLLICFDDVHLLAAEDGDALRQLVDAIPPPHRVVIAGRELPPAAAGLVGRPDTLVLGVDELQLTPDEVATVLAQGWGVVVDRGAEDIARSLAGWAAAIVLAGPRLAQEADPDLAASRLADRSAILPHLLAELLRPLDLADRDALVQASRLPRLGPQLDDALGRPGLFDRTRRAGLPFQRAGDWWTLPGPVHDHLAELGRPDGSTMRRVADVYARFGEAIRAIDVLLDVGDAPAAVDLLASLSLSRVDRLDPVELLALLDRVPGAALDASTPALLHLARACLPVVATRQRRTLLDRARLATRTETERRAVDAEEALDLARDGHVQDAEAMARGLLEDAPSDEILTRIRALDVLGRSLSWDGEDEATLRTAGAHLRRAVELSRRLAVAGLTADLLHAIGYRVELPLGRHELALEALDGAIAMIPGRLRQRGVIETFRADVLHDLGRYDEATVALAEARRFGALLDDERLLAYAAWEAAKGAARLGRAAETVDQLRIVERHRADWFAHGAGMLFLAEAADCCDRIGDRPRALAYLARAREHMVELGEDDVAVWLAEAAIEARSGESAAALRALDRVDALPGLPPKDRWRPALLRAFAAHRHGDPNAAGLARRAFELAATHGVERLPAVIEPAVVERLALLAEAAAGPTVARGAATVRVEVLGTFALTVGGRAVPVPPGRPMELVKVLACHCGRLPVDEAIEWLWPEQEPDTGRQRLRNVLHRLRRALEPTPLTTEGHELVVREGDRLRFPPRTIIDAEAFELLAQRADAEDHESRIGTARAAVVAYTGELLPDDRLAAWSVGPRERLRRRFLSVLDLAVDDAETRHDHDEVVRLLELALAADRDAEHRYVRAARAHAAAGRRSDARALLHRAAEVLDELDVPPSAEHAAARADLLS